MTWLPSAQTACVRCSNASLLLPKSQFIWNKYRLAYIKVFWLSNHANTHTETFIHKHTDPSIHAHSHYRKNKLVHISHAFVITWSALILSSAVSTAYLLQLLHSPVNCCCLWASERPACVSGGGWFLSVFRQILDRLSLFISESELELFSLPTTNQTWPCQTLCWIFPISEHLVSSFTVREIKPQLL